MGGQLDSKSKSVWPAHIRAGRWSHDAGSNPWRDFVDWMKRPLSAGEVTGILKGFLKCDDGSLSSHSLKATALSWAAKAEIPRDQRRILGRHASSVKDSDSFYSRDLSIGPVNSLQKVINMVRVGTFCPDATRANYFPNSAGASCSTPAHVVMQPFTPAFLEKMQPATPVLESKFVAPTVQKEVAAAAEALITELEVKTEDGWSVLRSGSDGTVIDISSESDQDSSESGTCTSTSGDGESIDLEPDDMDAGNEPPLAHGDVSEAGQVKNMKTKIVHEVRKSELTKDAVVEAEIDSVKGCLTLCGHVVTGNYMVLCGSFDWTAKCRVCFKGRRNPS